MRADTLETLVAMAMVTMRPCAAGGCRAGGDGTVWMAAGQAVRAGDAVQVRRSLSRGGLLGGTRIELLACKLVRVDRCEKAFAEEVGAVV